MKDYKIKCSPLVRESKDLDKRIPHYIEIL